MRNKVDAGHREQRTSYAPRGRATMAGSASHAEARYLADRLVGRPVPRVVLSGFNVTPLELDTFASACPTVFYFYPDASPEAGREMAPIDSAQHRTFRDHQPDLAAQGLRAIGISSQPGDVQRQSTVENRIGHWLLSDPELQLAWALGLPTFELDGTARYKRLLLLATGRVEAVFSVSDVAHGPAQVIAWTHFHGLRRGVADHDAVA